MLFSYAVNIGVFRWREEDLRRRIILAPYVLCFWFTCKGLYFSLALGSSLLPTLKRSYCSTRRHFCLVCPPDALKNRHKRHKKNSPEKVRSVANHDSKGRQFRLAWPRFDSCDNYIFLSPVIFNSFSILLDLGTTRTEISACKLNERLFRLQGSSSLLGGKQPLY